MIDPLESVIQWLTTNLTVVGGRVANKHRFTDNWTKGQKCLSVHFDSGMAELYAPVQDARFELRIYGASVADVMTVYGALVTLQRTQTRMAVTTSQGSALIHYFKQTSGLSLPYDDDLKMDVGVVFFDALVAETAIS